MFNVQNKVKITAGNNIKNILKKYFSLNFSLGTRKIKSGNNKLYFIKANIADNEDNNDISPFLIFCFSIDKYFSINDINKMLTPISIPSGEKEVARRRFIGINPIKNTSILYLGTFLIEKYNKKIYAIKLKNLPKKNT